MLIKIIKNIFRFWGIEITRFDKSKSQFGNLYDSLKDYTMIPKNVFVDNLHLANRYKNVKGDIVECGVWKGGMAAALTQATDQSRKIHLFDSFEGLPPAQEIDGQAALEWQANTTSAIYYDNCTADESFAIKALQIVNHSDYKVYKGWFNQTLPQYEGNPISILRLDGDWYDSIYDCLKYLYPYVVKGGIIILDDYYTWDGCSRAVHDYLSSTKSAARVMQWNNEVAYIIKTD